MTQVTPNVLPDTTKYCSKFLLVQGSTSDHLQLNLYTLYTCTVPLHTYEVLTCSAVDSTYNTVPVYPYPYHYILTSVICGVGSLDLGILEASVLEDSFERG